jgi:hypothetical protein
MAQSPVQAVCCDSAFRNQSSASVCSFLRGKCSKTKKVLKAAASGIRAIQLAGCLDDSLALKATWALEQGQDLSKENQIAPHPNISAHFFFKGKSTLNGVLRVSASS